MLTKKLFLSWLLGARELDSTLRPKVGIAFPACALEDMVFSLVFGED